MKKTEIIIVLLNHPATCTWNLPATRTTKSKTLQAHRRNVTIAIENKQKDLLSGLKTLKIKFEKFGAPSTPP